MNQEMDLQPDDLGSNLSPTNYTVVGPHRNHFNFLSLSFNIKKNNAVTSPLPISQDCCENGRDNEGQSDSEPKDIILVEFICINSW